MKEKIADAIYHAVFGTFILILLFLLYLIAVFIQDMEAGKNLREIAGAEPITCTITEMSSYRKRTGKIHIMRYYAVFEDETGVRKQFYISENLWDRHTVGDTVMIQQAEKDVPSLFAWLLPEDERTTLVYTLDDEIISD